MGTGERIRKARNTAGMTQQQLADAIGKTKSAIANYEKGDRTPDKATIADIAVALGILPESLKNRELETVADALDALLMMEEAGFGIDEERHRHRRGPERAACAEDGHGVGEVERAAQGPQGRRHIAGRVRPLAR